MYVHTFTKSAASQLLPQPEKPKDDAIFTLEDDTHSHFWSRNQRKRWLARLTLGTCVLYASRLTVPLVLPAMAQENHWTKTPAGTVLSSFFWGYVLTQVIGGRLSDQFGGERVVCYAAVGWSICTLFTPNVVRCFQHPDSLMLVLLRITHGAFQGLHYPSVSSLGARHLSEGERGSFFSAVTTGSAAGAVLAGTAGSSLMTYCGWNSVFQFVGICGLSWGLIMIFMNNKGTEKTVIQAARSGSGKMTSSHWGTILVKPEFWSCSFAHACHNNCYYIMLSWMPTYFHDAQFEDSSDWVFNVVPWLCVIPTTLLGGGLSEKLISRGYSITNTRKIVETLCLLLQAMGLVMISHAENFYGAVACASLVLGASGLHNNAVVVNPQDLAPQHAGSVFGLMNTIGSVPGFLGVYYVGYILDVSANWSYVFLMTALINIFGCFVYVLYGSAERVI